MHQWTEKIATLSKVKQRIKTRANKNNYLGKEDRNRLHEEYRKAKRALKKAITRSKETAANNDRRSK